MEDDKNKPAANEPKQQAEKQGINLNDYAGDAEDDKAAREQSDRYTKDLDRNLNEQFGDTSDQVSDE